jgi:tetratricopeptide (TPR) repeat protein
MRRFDEAESALLRSVELEPEEAIYYTRLVYLYLKEDGRDTRRARGVVEQYPTPRDGEMDGELWWLDLVDRNFEAALATSYGQRNAYRRALALELAGRVEAARPAWDSVSVGVGNVVSENPQAWNARLTLARAYAGIGRDEEAVAQVDTALAQIPFERDAVDAADAHYRAATIFARAGAPERAAEVIEILLERPTGVTAAELDGDPEMDVVRDHPRIRALLDR